MLTVGCGPHWSTWGNSHASPLHVVQAPTRHGDRVPRARKRRVGSCMTWPQKGQLAHQFYHILFIRSPHIFKGRGREGTRSTFQGEPIQRICGLILELPHWPSRSSSSCLYKYRKGRGYVRASSYPSFITPNLHGRQFGSLNPCKPRGSSWWSE